MGYHQVSEENLKKVEAFFVRRAKETGSNRIEATVIEIAEGSEVALATAHKAVKELIFKKTIQVIKPKSRRFPITYIYASEISDFEEAKSEKEQIEYLKRLVAQLTTENESLKRELNEEKGKRHIMNR